MADTIVDGTLFNAQNIKYSAPKATSAGGKSINILNKDTNKGLRVAAPLMLTWGASDYQDNKKFEMSLQFPSGDYANEDTSAFLKNMAAFEKKVKADAVLYSKEWFGKQKSAEVIDETFTPMLKHPYFKGTKERDVTKSPTLSVKIPMWEGVWKCEIYEPADNDDDENPKLFPSTANPNATPIEFLLKGTNVACLLQCGGIWFANGNFGVTWKLVQAVVQKRESLTGKCFIKLKKEDKAKLQTVLPPAEDNDEGTSALVEDSDDEEEPVQVVAPVAPAAAAVAVAVEAVEEKPKKKVVKKKVEA